MKLPRAQKKKICGGGDMTENEKLPNMMYQ